MKKLTSLIATVLMAGLIPAQNTIQFDFTFNHLALSVKDLNRSVAFYKKVFQLPEITNRSAIEGIRWISMGEGKELHLISIIKEPVTLNKAIHHSFATDKIDAFEKRLIEMRIPYSDWPGTLNTINTRADGIKQIYFQDPDGYWIEINNGYAAPTPAEPNENVYIILEIEVKDTVNYESYRKQVEPIIEQYGGRYLVRSGAKSFDNNIASAITSPEGNWYPDRIIVLEFPSKEKFQQFVSSPEYKPVTALRHSSSVTRSILANGYRTALVTVSSTQQIKDKLWQLEENYWKYVKNKDLKSYLTLWDENFIGYPSTNVIGTKEHITDWITELYKDKTGSFNYELTRKVENVFGDIVIVLYDVTHFFTNDKNEAAKKSTFKITHTWKKTDKGWLIIGGMGAIK